MRIGIFFMCLLPVLAGCQSVKTYYEITDPTYVSANYYVHPEFDQMSIRRVLFAPIRNETTYFEETLGLDDAFMKQWSAIHRFELLPAMGGLRDSLQNIDLRGRGRFYKLRLFDIGERFNIDAIIFTTLTSYFPYEPCQLGINAQMIHTRTGDIVWAVDEHYDGNQREVANLAKEYYYEKLRFSHPLTDWKTMLVSMKYFSEMAASNIAHTFIQEEKMLRIDESLLKTATVLDAPPRR